MWSRAASFLAPFRNTPAPLASSGQSFTDGSSYFHAFDARIEKRFSHGFLMLVNFQKSKLMEKRSRLNDLDPLLEKRIAAEDRPYRLVWSGTYDLPFGRGKALLRNANRLADLAVGGWNVNLITTFTTGTALGWGNVIYLGGPLNLDPHNVDSSFDVIAVQPRQRAATGVEPADLPHAFREPARGQRATGRFLDHQGIPHHRAGADDLSLRVLQQHQPRDLQSAGSGAHIVHVRQDSVAGEYAAPDPDGFAAGILAA